MLLKSFESVCIWSQNYKKLANWYKETFDLEIDTQLDLSDDTGIGFMLGEVFFWIGEHDQVKGKSHDPYRIMPGFNVDSVTELYEHISKKGVEFIRKPSLSPTKDYYAATALDPDGNVIQFFSKGK